MKKISSDNRGIAHLALIAVIVVVVAAVGFAAYRVMNQDKDTTGSASTGKQSTEVPCDSDDKDLCKFFSSWKANKQYRMTTKTDGKDAGVYEIDGDKSRVVMNMEGSKYEVITIDKTTYTKAGSTWYKQTNKETEDDVAKDIKPDFEEPKDEDQGEATAPKTSYKKIGKEACGDLTCFKYQVVDADAEANEKQFIWFDDKDYQMRRSLTETKEGTMEMTFEYSGVSISEPSPVKELGPNQYIVPGQSEPVTIPTGGDGL